MGKIPDTSGSDILEPLPYPSRTGQNNLITNLKI
jgi:hypothetical protein